MKNTPRSPKDRETRPGYPTKMTDAELWKNRETLEKALIVLHGTATLAQAQLMLVGNCHTDAAHTIYSQQLINREAKPGDVVLVEGVPQGIRIDPDYERTRAITVPVEVWGWDNMELNDLISSHFTQAVQLHELLATDMAEGDRIAIINRIHWLIGIIDDLAVTQRNQSLWAAVVEARRTHPSARIFVQAGFGHFSDPILKEKLAGQKYIAVTFKPPDRQTTVEEDFQETIRYYLGNR